MLTDAEMIGLQAEKHDLIDAKAFSTREEYVLHLVHTAAYEHAARLAREQRVLDLVSAEAVKVAASRHRDIHFQVVDGQRLPFVEASFDLVTSFQVIEHIVDHRRYLEEIQRVLRPGGTVLFTTPNAVLRLDPGMKPWNRFHVREFNAEELTELLRRYFPEVQVQGLFADDELYAVERRRLTTARANARLQAGGRRAMMGALTKARNWLAGAHKPTPLDDQFRQRHGTDSFRYRDTRLAEALDLLATCKARRD